MGIASSEFIAFSGSPRKKGNSETLLAAVTQGIELEGGSVETVRICDLHIGPCIACGGCDKTGRCVIDDDMQNIYGKIVTAKNIILASPIYFYGLSAQMKMFVDRMQALWARKQLLAAQGKWLIEPDKKGYFISVAATHGPKIFDGSKMCVQYAYDAMGFNYSGELFVRGVDKRADSSSSPEKLERAVAFGRSIAVP
nr:flavodoxin family protein [Desulfobulbaceae bacterium]